MSGALRVAFGLVGAGRHGSRYARHIVHDLPDARLAGLWRRDAQAGRQQAGELGCSFFADPKELIRCDEVEAMILAVPPGLHVTLCSAAAEAGKAILVEKPLAVNRQAAERIRDALSRHPVSFMVAHTLRYNPVVRALSEHAASLGALHSLHLSQCFEPSTLSWLDDPSLSGGGIVIHTGVHSFDLVRFLSGAEVRRVHCRTWAVATKKSEDNFVALLELANGAAASVIGSRSTAGRNGLIEITGSGGQLVGDHVHNDAWVIEGRSRRPLDLVSESRTVLLALRDFISVLRDGRQAPISFDDGYASVSIAEACYRSVEAGSPVDVEP